RLSGNGCVGTDRGGVDAGRAGDGDGGCLSWNAGDSNFREAGAATAGPVRRVCWWRGSGIVVEPLAAENFDLRKTRFANRQRLEHGGGAGAEAKVTHRSEERRVGKLSR